MEMLEHTVSTDGDRAVVDNGLPEEIGCLTPFVVLLYVGNSLESDNLRDLA